MPARRATTIAGSKSRIEMLRALRDKLAELCDEGRADLPALALRLQSVLAEIDELGGATPVADPVDELEKRRRERRGNA